MGPQPRLPAPVDLAEHTDVLIARRRDRQPPDSGGTEMTGERSGWVEHQGRTQALTGVMRRGCCDVEAVEEPAKARSA